MSDLISRQAAIELIESESKKWGSEYELSDVLCDLSDLPSAEKTGHWIEKNRVYSEESHIEDWQSCCCSVCGHYDTRPYMYYFDEPNYCSYCGARMVGEEE